MAEDLAPGDVEAYTKGVLLASDAETLRALNSALTRCRNYCGWHVSPVKTDTVMLHGSGHRFIVLPTLKVDSLISIVENDVVIDVTTIDQYTQEPGVLYKRRGCWHGRIEIVYSHGFAAAEAQDFRETVLSLIDQVTASIGTGRSGPMISKRVDDVDISWSGLPRAIDNAPMDKSVLDKYLLSPFA